MPKHSYCSTVKRRFNWFQMAKEKNVTYGLVDTLGSQGRPSTNGINTTKKVVRTSKASKTNPDVPRPHPKLVPPEVYSFLDRENQRRNELWDQGA